MLLNVTLSEILKTSKLTWLIVWSPKEQDLHIARLPLWIV